MGGEVLPIILLSSLPRIWESQEAGGGRVVDLGHSARCHGSWHIVPCRSKKKKKNSNHRPIWYNIKSKSY
ncbi:hypothetical protein HanRHA438_Chr13g0620881 [Helianthus annuus]|nr:hypothetical protein HanRHA438_Chr13g0620881 [Helianthus annuus]